MWSLLGSVLRTSVPPFFRGMFYHFTESICGVEDLICPFLAQAFGEFVAIFFSDVQHFLLPFQWILIGGRLVESVL